VAKLEASKLYSANAWRLEKSPKKQAVAVT
jgi:hypothetical protein